MSGPRTRRSTSELLSATRQVVDAGRDLEDVLDEDRTTVRLMARRLEKRLAEMDPQASALQELAFEDLEAEALGEVPEPAVDEILGTVLIDIQAGRLAVAASGAAGESGAGPGHQEYAEALTDLKETERAFDRAPATLGLEAPAEPRRIASPDEASARATFRDEATRTLDSIVTGTEGVVTATMDEIKRLPFAATLDELIRRAGGWKGPVPKAGPLLRLGLKKLKRALESLSRLFKLPQVEELKEKLAAFWQEVTGEGFLTTVVKRSVRIGAAESRVASALNASPLAIDTLDEASGSLAALTERYDTAVRRIRLILKAYALCAAALGVAAVAVPVITPWVAAVSAAFYLFTLAGVLSLARDYADSGKGLGRVAGVGSVAGGLVVR
jgi:hypothetical protein